MREHPPFRYLRPHFCAGLLDDPMLLVQVRPLGDSLLFDCGQLHHLAKRVLKSVTDIFVTHAHMDHFMGIDTIIRHNHVAPKTINIHGPPGIAAKLAAKLSGYDWNLTEPYWCSFKVSEIHVDNIKTFLLHGPDGFKCHLEQELPRQGKCIFNNEYLQVEAEQCDHKIPVLIFRINEHPPFQIDEKRLDEEGLVKGDWLRELKQHLHGNRQTTGPLMAVEKNANGISYRQIADVHELYRKIRKITTASGIGYMTDLGFSEENMKKVLSLMKGITLLVCECSFLTEDIVKARNSFHLSTSDCNFLLDRLQPRFFLPLHISKTYLGRSESLYQQFILPPGVSLLRMPEHITPRPLQSAELPNLRSTTSINTTIRPCNRDQNS